MADDLFKLVKQQTDIVRIIDEYVKLRKSGAQNYSGLCPFHKEKSPSFSVNVAGQFFYCFGCHEKGDVFTFVSKMENVSVGEALRMVAAKGNIQLPKREFNSPEEAREAGLRRQLMDAHEAATQYFEAMLKSPEAARAREYLTGRGVTPDTIAKFRIGYAPESFNDMRDKLGKHFPEPVLRESGLFSAKEQADGSGGPLYARFRKRITFPICNEQGRVIAFTARALDSDEKSGPKYMNSPETALYTKGSVLFNLDKAKQAIKAQDFALMVEGQMDCISVYMAGVQNVIATSGTAFTEIQARLLGRFSKRVVVNFDPDNAGANAAEKTISLLTGDDFEVRVVALEGGLDPDRYVREQGVAAYMAALRGAKRHSDYLIDRARTLFPGRTGEAKVKAMNFLLPHIRRMPNALLRDEFVSDAAQKLAIDSAVLRQEIKQAAAQRLDSVRSVRQEPLTEIERVLIHALVLPETEPARATAANALSENTALLDGLAAGALLESLALSPVPENPLDAAPDDASRTLLAQTLFAASSAPEGDSEALERQVTSALNELQIRSLERQLSTMRSAMNDAARRGDDDMQFKLLGELRAVQVALQGAQQRMRGGKLD